MGQLKDFLSKFPSVFNRLEGSNIGKLLNILSGQMDDVTQVLLTTESWRSIDEAEGSTLDLLGDDMNLKRGINTDSGFRIMIRGKQARINSDATINRIIQAIAATLNRQVNEIAVKNGYEIPENKSAFLMVSIKKNEQNYDMPLPQLEDVISGAVGIEWEYIIGTDYELSSPYSSILYPFEYYSGWVTPDGQQQTNDNADVLNNFTFSQTPDAVLQDPYPIAGDYEQINGNVSSLDSYNLSSSNSITAQDSYPICGTFVAGEVV